MGEAQAPVFQNCIGSAFNVKGAMQCPNCRKIEKGQWLYAHGSRPLPEFNMDDWAHDEDLYDLSYSEMSFGVHWCPFSGLTRLPTSFDDGEFSSSAYHDLFGHQSVFAEHTTLSSTTHPCPYIAYFGPIHPSSSMSSGSVSDGFNYNSWSGPSVPSEVPNSYAFPSMDVHYHNWDHSPPFAPSNRIDGADQPVITSVSQRTSRNSSDIPRTGMHPFVLGHSSASRAPSSVTSSVVPPYPGTVTRPRERPSLQAYFQQSTGNAMPAARSPVISAGRRSSTHRGLAQVAPLASSSDQSNGFYFFSSSSGRTIHEVENPHRDVFHVWEREHQPSFPLGQVDRDSIWGPFHPPPPAPARSDAGFRPSSFHQRHGSQNRS
ncbi:hypothetical protein ACS0TY_002263 [Phlomoides rotata]